MIYDWSSNFKGFSESFDSKIFQNMKYFKYEDESFQSVISSLTPYFTRFLIQKSSSN